MLILIMKVKGDQIKRERLRTFFFRNFIGGIATGLGLTVGISLIAYLFSLLIPAFEGLPVIGNGTANIFSSIVETLRGK